MMRSNRYHTDAEYKQYLEAYDRFYNARLAVFEGGCPRLDSQFSESIAADYSDFTLDHPVDGDGTNSKGETYEVKGTGYTNSKVRFNTTSKPDHIIWVEALPNKVTIYEIDKAILGKLDSNGFVDLSKASKLSTIATFPF